MSGIRNFFSNLFYKENVKEFQQKRFMHNNLCIVTLAIYLTVEQLYYGLYVTASGGLIQTIHLATALVMGVYSIVGTYIQIKKVKNVAWFLKIYEISFGFFGFAIAIARALLVQNNMFELPTIYVAVIYGFAVFFYFTPIITFCVYCTTSISIIILLPIFQPEMIQGSYVEDIVSNNIIAWIASVISYHRCVREFKSQKTISDKNKQLQAKTMKIEKINEALQYTSSMDDLTNIFNRRKLNEILEMEYERCNNGNKKISLILLDIDLFKSINDTYGHNVGDMVLSKIGEILKNNVRQNEKVGRWGGEEFLIICPETDFENALHLAERIRKIVEEHNFHLKNKVTCSFGVATNVKKDSISNLLLRADMGLYKAKGSGRNRVENGEGTSVVF